MADVEQTAGQTRRERQGRADQGRVGQRRDTSFSLLFKWFIMSLWTMREYEVTIY